MCMFLYMYDVLWQLFHWEGCPLSPPRIFFQKAADLLHSTKSSCFTPILTIKFFPPRYLGNIHFGHLCYYLGGGEVREKSPFIPDPFDTLIYFCAYLRKFCIFKIHSSQEGWVGSLSLPGKLQLFVYANSIYFNKSRVIFYTF